MRFVKPRKPRGIKLDGTPSIDFCEVCKMPGCDPCGASLKYLAKTFDREERGVCTACGHNPCRCKSRLSVSEPIMVTHNNRKARRKNDERDSFTG